MIATVMTSRQQTLFCDRESLQKWKVTMRTSNTQARKFSATVGKIVMALVFVSMIVGISIAPAFARDSGRGHRGGYHGRGGYGYGVYQPYGYYPAPVYAPPPVVYAPAPYMSPGISLVLPIHIR
jgi:hypothetical protein